MCKFFINRYGEKDMKKISMIVAILTLTLAFAGVAFAEDGGFYGSIKAGGSYLDSSKSLSSANATTGSSSKWERNSGAVGVAAGYNWMSSDLPIRTELEYMYNGDFKYKYADDNATFNNKINIQTLMLNVYWDFYNDTAFTPYINGGVGAAFIDEKYSSSAVQGGNAITDAKKSSTNFAFNLGAGVGWNLTESVILDLAYRYDYYGNGKKVTMESVALGDYTSQVKNMGTHKALLGLRYQF